MANSIATVEDMDIAIDPEDQAEYELARMRHSTAHLMAEAVQEMFPDAKFGIGPAIDNGFYYDFDLPRPLTPDDLKVIEKRMLKNRKKNDRFERREVSRSEALEIFGDNPY
nr:threonine--tRNA ligase [Chloroflexia bacterium]